jgi:hypothetical protein
MLAAKLGEHLGLSQTDKGRESLLPEFLFQRDPIFWLQGTSPVSDQKLSLTAAFSGHSQLATGSLVDSTASPA